MVNTLVFYALLATCCVYVARRGGAPEWIGASIIVVGSLLTLITLSNAATIYRSVEVGVFLVDVAALVAFLVLALRAERLWPLCIVALQLIGTAGHAVKLVDPQILPLAYAFALRFWGYPMIALLVLGTWNHQRRLARFGVDKSWSSSSGRSATPPRNGPTA
ncbi:MAG TPA: hypothetical protein VF535_15815 [Allosphingosinicella sp.]